MSKKKDLFEGLSKERLEKALSILYSNEEFDVRVKLTLKEEYRNLENSCKKLHKERGNKND